MFNKIKRKFCKHRFIYASPVFNIQTHKIVGYEYECGRCGAILYTPKEPGRTYAGKES